MSEIGRGRLVAGGSQQVRGRFTAVLEVDALLGLLDSDDGELIIYLSRPNVTMIAPLYERLVGIVCEHGNETSHVAIVARELSLPCVVQAHLEHDIEELEGRWVLIDEEGTLRLQ